MTTRIPPVFALVAVLLVGSASPQTQRSFEVKAEAVGSDGVPIRSAFLELRPKAVSQVGMRAGTSAMGIVVIPSVPLGKYEMSVEAGGFMALSQSIEIDGNKDLGRIVMDADPDVIKASSGSLLSGIPAFSVETETRATPLPASATPSIFRGSIRSSIIDAKRLAVQLSCSEQRPGMPERPQYDVARISVDSAGDFESAVPECSGDTLAHRELRLSLKDENGSTIALLLPKMTLGGYYQSKIGIWLPLKPFVEQPPAYETIFVPEFTDNRSLRAILAVSPLKEHFVVGEQVFLNAKLTNTSDEVLAVPFTDILSVVSWLITDDNGNNVPFRLFGDRTLAAVNGTQPSRSHILFPGESETHGVNVSVLFTLTSPGTYHVVAREIVRRPEAPGQEQITSAQMTFVITGK